MTRPKRAKRKPPAPIAPRQDDRLLCQCPVGLLLGDCPFSYANGWHERREEMLMRSLITPAVAASVKAARAKLSPDELLQL